MRLRTTAAVHAEHGDIAAERAELPRITQYLPLKRQHAAEHADYAEYL